MIRRLFAGLAAAALLAGPAAAITNTGPLIKSAIPDQSRYAPGAVATIPIVLANNTGASQAGTMSCQRYGRGVATGAPAVASFGPLAPGASATVSAVFALTSGLDNRGYQVICTATGSSGAVLDTAATALDVSSSPYTFARECMATEFYPGMDIDAEMRGLRAYHCSVLQFYDAYATATVPYTPVLTFPNLEQHTVGAQALRKYIALGNQAGAAPFFFFDWAIVGQHAFSGGQDGSSIPLSWGLFREPISTDGKNTPTNCSPNCTAANLARTPTVAQGTFPSSWTDAWLYEMDPTNTGYWAYWISTVRPMMDHFGFAGCQIDTLGDFGTGYNAAGGTVNYSSAASAFINAVRGPGCRGHATFNNVSGGLSTDTIQNSSEDFFYSERHPEFGDATTLQNVHDSAGYLKYLGAKAQNWAVYVDECAANPGNTNCSGTATPAAGAPNSGHCSTAYGADTCYLNEPGLRYLEATMLASGVWHNGYIDGPPAAPDDPLFISNILVNAPAAQLAAYPSTKQAMLDYASFGVAHEKELRDSSDDSAHAVSITSGGCPGVATTAGTAPTQSVYMIPRARAGLQTVSLLNFCGLTNLGTQDRNGTQPAPTLQANVAVKMYYGGSITGSNSLWLSSPDMNHGAPTSIAYAKGSDAGGAFITFTVPTLLYWSFAELELDALATSDYAAP